MSRDTVRIKATLIINGEVHRRCPKCEVLKPLDDFGLRRMKNAGVKGSDLVTNQSQCRDCRNSIKK